VAVGGVAVVALLGAGRDAVTARRVLDLTARRAAVAVGGVVVVALLAAFEDAVAARGGRTAAAGRRSGVPSGDAPDAVLLEAREACAVDLAPDREAHRDRPLR